MTSDAATVQLRQGRLYIARAVHDGVLQACPAVALVARDGQWWLLPLLGGAGGLQVKLRNAAGDRVVEAQEFFRAQGVDDAAPARVLRLVADAEQGACRLVAD